MNKICTYKTNYLMFINVISIKIIKNKRNLINY